MGQVPSAGIVARLAKPQLSCSPRTSFFTLRLQMQQADRMSGQRREVRAASGTARSKSARKTLHPHPSKTLSCNLVASIVLSRHSYRAQGVSSGPQQWHQAIAVPLAAKLGWKRKAYPTTVHSKQQKTVQPNSAISHSASAQRVPRAEAGRKGATARYRGSQLGS